MNIFEKTKKGLFGNTLVKGVLSLAAICALSFSLFFPPTPVFAQSSSGITLTDGGLEESGGKYKWHIIGSVTSGQISDGTDLRIILSETTQGSPVKLIDGVVTVVNGDFEFISPSILEKGHNYGSNVGLTGSGYTSISNTLIIHIDDQGVATQGGQGSTGGVAQTSPQSNSNLPICWLGLTQGGISMGGCIAQGIYYLLFVPTSFILSLSGYLFDFTMGYTLDSASYSSSADGSSFVEKGWVIMRDIANILFIFILLYTAIGTILNLHEVDAKKIIPKIIIVALLINFSLFFTRIIIDTANIVGRIFYENIGVTNGDTQYALIAGDSDKSISVAIASRFNPQTLFSQAGKLTLNTPGGVTDVVATKGPPAGPFAIISLIMSAINLVAAYVFFVVGFLFIGRVVALWLAMIFAPFAFITYAIPGGSKIKGFGYHEWWNTLLSQAMVVPVFMFFMYLILMFLKIDFIQKTIDQMGNGTTMQVIMGVVIPLVFITILLLKAKEKAIELSGEIGTKMVDIAKFAGGAAVGLAAGGVAFAGRNFVGRIGLETANSEKLRKIAAESDSWLGRKSAQSLLGITNTLAKGSFDPRQTGALKAAGKQTGFNFDNGLVKATGLDSSKFKGGRKAQYEHEVDHVQKKANTYMMTPARAKIQDEKASKWKEKYEGTKDTAEKNVKSRGEAYNKIYADAKAAAMAAGGGADPAALATWQAKMNNDLAQAKIMHPAGLGTFDEAKFKKDYEEGKAVTIGTNTVVPSAKPTGKGFDEAQFKKDYEDGKEIAIGDKKIKGAGKPPIAFDEKKFDKEFKQAYVKGLPLKDDYGIDEAGAPEELTSKEVNKVRRQKYADKLAEEHNLPIEVKVVRNFLNGAVSNPALLAGVVATLASGGAAGLGALGVAGTLHVIREIVLPGVHADDSQVVASVRSGEDKSKKLLKDLKKEISDDDHGGEKGDHGGGGHH